MTSSCCPYSKIVLNWCFPVMYMLLSSKSSLKDLFPAMDNVTLLLCKFEIDEHVVMVNTIR